MGGAPEVGASTLPYGRVTVVFDLSRAEEAARCHARLGRLTMGLGFLWPGRPASPSNGRQGCLHHNFWARHGSGGGVGRRGSADGVHKCFGKTESAILQAKPEAACSAALPTVCFEVTSSARR